MMITISSFLPIASLLVCLLVLKMPASKSGAISFLVALAVSVITFRPGVAGLASMLSKGFGLAMFVVFIIWGAMFLYNTVKEVGALEVINKNISIIIEDRYVQFMFLAWVFAPFLQGIAGFGVPVIVVTPILIAMGFDPVISAVGVLLGHSWAISFGSMGSSIYAIDMVTDADLNQVVAYMAIYGAVSMLAMGLAVSAVYGGAKGVWKGAPYVLITSMTMSATLYILARLGMVSVMGLVTGIAGLATMYIICRVKNKGKEIQPLYKGKLTLAESVLPYALIVLLSVTFFILKPAQVLSLDFPGYETALGVVVPEELKYVSFNLLKFPFSIIVIASLLSIVVYRERKCFDAGVAKTIISSTVKKCVPTTITLIFLLCMAQIMMDSQMVANIAAVMVAATNRVYPLVAPFIGLLGAFVTGSNTNSNVLFGALQEASANALGFSAAIMCAVQSLGGSIGGAIGPTTVALGATSAQISGQESKIYKYTLMPVLATALLLGIVNIILINVG